MQTLLDFYTYPCAPSDSFRLFSSSYYRLHHRLFAVSLYSFMRPTLNPSILTNTGMIERTNGEGPRVDWEIDNGDSELK